MLLLSPLAFQCWSVSFQSDRMPPALIVFAESYTKTSKIKLKFKTSFDSKDCKTHQKKWLLVAAQLLGTTLSTRSAHKKKYKGNITQTRGQRKKNLFIRIGRSAGNLLTLSQASHSIWFIWKCVSISKVLFQTHAWPVLPHYSLSVPFCSLHSLSSSNQTILEPLAGKKGKVFHLTATTESQWAM